MYLQLRKAFQMMLSEYKVVTDQDKAEVVSLGGLHVIGTERHESRRIDNQLRGRSGRQGDPGSTRCGDESSTDSTTLRGWQCSVNMHWT